MGWSLELAGPPWKSLFEGDVPTGRALVPDRESSNVTQESTRYAFKVQIGDTCRDYDGLVRYFRPNEKPVPGNGLDLCNMFTHFGPDAKPSDSCTKTSASRREDTTPRIIQTDKSRFLTPSAYYASPYDVDSPEKYTDKINRELRVVGALLNPFLPCHAYSGISPIRELSLPAWTWQSSISRMAAFFHADPVSVTRNEPKFDADKELVAAAVHARTKLFVESRPEGRGRDDLWVPIETNALLSATSLPSLPTQMLTPVLKLLQTGLDVGVYLVRPARPVSVR